LDLRVNEKPVVTTPIVKHSTRSGKEMVFPIPTNTFTDPDGDVITYSLTKTPVWLTMATGTNIMKGTPSEF
jgi:hypothetical protein